MAIAHPQVLSENEDAKTIELGKMEYAMQLPIEALKEGILGLAYAEVEP